MPRLQAAAIGFLLTLSAGTVPLSAAEDLREPVALPPEIKDAFLAEMRGHMGNLDDILAALAEGDFKSAADIADITMDFGHRIWEGLAAQGMSAEEILAVKKSMRGLGMGTGQHQGRGQGQGQGTGQGRGFGRFMPEGFRAMGQDFHEAAASFAVALRAMGPEPSAADYRTAIGLLGEVTAACRGCHDAYRVE